MAREEKVRTKGTAFVKLVKKNGSGNWTDAVLVHNLSKSMPDGKPKNVGWGMPGGGVREDEDPHEGAVRELFEETNALVNVAKKLREKFALSRPGDDFDYMIYLEDPEALQIQRFERMSKDLDGYTKTITESKEGQDKLRDAVLGRNKLIQEYAKAARELGLIKMISQPKSEPSRDGGTHLTYMFEVDAADVANINDLHCNNDLARTVDGWMWISREQLEERGRNFKDSFQKPDYIYVAHLRRMEVVSE